MVFAVAAGQVGRLGQKLEKGGSIGWKQVIIELSMLPAFGSLGGAFAIDQGWPVWAQLGCGITAGWLGFGSFKMLTAAMRTLATQWLKAGKPD
jgi:hypothetical protein